MSDVEDQNQKTPVKKRFRYIRYGYWLLNFIFLASLIWIIAPQGYRAAEDWREGHVLVSISQAPEIRDLAKNLTHWDFQQIDCLTKNAYFEARGEGDGGISRVIDVVLNRAADRHRYPDGPCQVITEPKQFSWYSDGQQHDIRDWPVYNHIYNLAYNGYVYRKAGLVPDLTNGATHYHNDTVRPKWKWDFLGRFGHHLFYK